ncbi:MAG: hypothetical protein U0236_15335 [Nitrospira sp.]
MRTIDLWKELKHLYQPSAKDTVRVEVSSLPEHMHWEASRNLLERYSKSRPFKMEDYHQAAHASMHRPQRGFFYG